MKKFLLLPLLAVLVLPVFAQEQSSSAAADASGEKVLYSLGYLLGENLKNNLLLNSEDDFKAVDALLNRNSQTNL